MEMRKIWSICLCLMLLFAYVPVGVADEVPVETTASNNADLSSLSVTEGKLNPIFAVETMEYAVNVPFETTNVQITAETADENATMNISGSVDDLDVGVNAAAVEVTAEDGKTFKTYTITITRAEEESEADEPAVSDNAALSSLVVKDYELNKVFEAEIMAYSAEIPNEVESIGITATTEDEKATLKINGVDASSGNSQMVDNLLVGANLLNVQVTAEVGTVKTYTITINRAEEETKEEEPGESDDASLQSLVVKDYELNPGFDTDIKGYTVEIPNDADSVEVKAIVEDENASLFINDIKVSSGEIQPVDNLEVGDNPVAVKVTAADDKTIQTYFIVIKRSGEPMVEPMVMRAPAGAEMNPLPDNAVKYAESDYAVYRDHMAVGADHIAVVKIDGTVAAWGDNTYGQCDVPEGLTNVKAVAAGIYDTLALTNDGRVYAWGSNINSSEEEVPVTIPEKVTNAQGNIKLIAAGGATLAVVTESNEVMVWGKQQSSLQASQPKEFGNIVAIAVNSTDVAVLDGNGNVTAWGKDAYKSSALAGKTTLALSAGLCHFVALTTNGKAVVWGTHASDCNGITITEQDTEQGNIRAIAGGSKFAGALLADGSVKGWGTNPADNNVGGTELIPAGANIKALSSDTDGESVCALKGDGTLFVIGPDGPEGLKLLNSETKSDNADLKSLSVKEVSLTPEFAADETQYTVNVPYEKTSVTITAETADDNANLQITGPVDNLGVGVNTAAVEVTAEDGETSKTYNITIIRAAAASASSNADLESLSVAEGLLTPDFTTVETQYTVNVSNETTSVTITAVKADENANLQITGPVDNLQVGDNAAAVVVTAEDNTTIKTYNITITRADTSASSNTDLKSLSVNEGSLTPEFSAEKTQYTVNVSNETTSVTITAVKADENATVQITGPVDNLAVGVNAAAVVVTAEDSTIKTYNITITRAISTNADLASLTIEADDGTDVTECGIYPKFSSQETEGIIDVANGVNEVRITAQPYSDTSTLNINGAPVIVGDAAVINGSDLDVGDNLIEIEVTAASGNQRSYTLHIKKVSADYALPALPQTPAEYQESEYAAYSRRIGTGKSHVLVVKEDGTVAAWGDNGEKQCNVPHNLDNVIAVAAGKGHSLALKADGTVVAWGQNLKGQCEVPGTLKRVVDICAVGDASAALDVNGVVWVWGDNTFEVVSAIPSDLKKVPSDLKEVVVDIQGGSRQVLALQANGEVRIWGGGSWINDEIQIDDTNVVAISAGEKNNVALKKDGTMVIWGAGKPRYEIENLNLQYVRGIATGYYCVAALKWDGSVAVWGQDKKKVSLPLELDEKILAISGSGSNKYLVTLNEDGTLNGYGDENSGVCDIPARLNHPPYTGDVPDIPQTPADYAASDYVQARAKICYTTAGYAILNMDGTVKFIRIPTANDEYGLVNVPKGLNNVKAIASSIFYNVMALKKDGTVVVWGMNDDGQCEVPADVKNITAIAATGDTNDCCLALNDEGEVLAWGYNDEQGTFDVPSDLGPVAVIAAGNNHCLALQEGGTVRAWGKNDYGQCDVPNDLENVARIFASGDFSLALKNDGTVEAWGKNDYGQCDLPASLTGVVDIYIADTKCIALRDNGTAVMWGYNYYGSYNVPGDLHDAAAVSVGSQGGAAIKTDGTVENWGGLWDFDDELLGRLSNVLTIKRNIIIFRDGSLQYIQDNDTINGMLEGLNVLSGHYFNIDDVKLLNPAGNEISTVAKQGGYRIKTDVDNNYASPTSGLTIIQVRGGENVDSSSGGQVLECVGIFSETIPVGGSSFSSDFTLTDDISGDAYVDVFVWEDWETMVPRASADQSLSFTVNE